MYKIMDKQMTDISKLYMATMTYNMHLNTLMRQRRREYKYTVVT